MMESLGNTSLLLTIILHDVWIIKLTSIRSNTRKISLRHLTHFWQRYMNNCLHFYFLVTNLIPLSFFRNCTNWSIFNSTVQIKIKNFKIAFVTEIAWHKTSTFQALCFLVYWPKMQDIILRERVELKSYLATSCVILIFLSAT